MAASLFLLFAGQVNLLRKTKLYCWALNIIYLKAVLAALIMIMSVYCLWGNYREVFSFLFFILKANTQILAFLLKASLWEPTIQRVIPMFIHERGVLLTCKQEKSEPHVKGCGFFWSVFIYGSILNSALLPGG